MKSYIYELIAYDKNGYKMKRFIGNDTNVLQERYECWVIKQGTAREEIHVYLGEIQHAGYKPYAE